MTELQRFEDADKCRWYAANEDKFKAGECYISVTTVLDIICPAFLKRWYINNDKDYIESHSQETAAIGTALHESIQADLMGETPVILRGTEKAFDNYLRLKKKHNIQAIEIERRVFNNDFGYAGSLDVLGEVDGKLSVVDIKTGSYNIKTGWQMAAYKYALEKISEHRNLGMVGLHVKRDGTSSGVYTYQQYESCYKAFLSAWNAWRMQEYNKLKKMKWKRLNKDPFTINYGGA